MAIKGILFNSDMVRAILDSRKTVTRRVVKPQPQTRTNVKFIEGKGVYWSWWMDGDYHLVARQPYQPGDTLYVRETWAQFNRTAFNDYLLYPSGGLWSAYKADGELRYNGGENIGKLSGCEKFKWHPSIHMPKKAARIWLKVTDVRVERLQDMKFEDCLAEGAFVYLSADGLFNRDVVEPEAKQKYAQLWDSTIPKKNVQLYGWDANPWVFVIEFERTEKPDE